jgi:membrane-anchored protein YejM (alkaline phosphatase superfamily)
VIVLQGMTRRSNCIFSFPCLAIATSNAKTAHMERKYQKELTQTLEEKDNTKKQLLVSEKTSAQIQATLAAVVAEKEKLFNEYNEMKAVCEELMSIVEGGAASA